MSKKKFIVSEIVIGVVALMAILFGVFYSNITGLFTKGTNPNSLGDGDIDKTFTFKCNDSFVFSESDPELEGYVMLYYDSNDVGMAYYVHVPTNIGETFYYRNFNLTGTYNGVFKKADSAIKENALSSIENYYIEVSDYIEELDYENDPALQKEVHDSITDYYIEVVSINEAPSIIPQVCAYVIGVVLILALIIRLVAFVSKKSAVKIALITAGAILLIVAILIGITFNKLRTILSVKQEGEGIYSMSFYGDSKVDKLMSANISTTDELINWIISEQLYGIPITIDEANFGCSAFACSNESGDTLFCRNFDYYDTDTIVIYTNPKDGYASYSLSDLSVLGLGNYDIKPDSVMGRVYMLAAPYMCVDGINEAGLAVGILELDTEELHQDNGNPDLLIYCAIRAVLDNCATVNEAIDLLRGYDIHSSLGVTYHLQVVDKSGRSVVIEWLDNQMMVNELNASTNSVLTPGEHFDEGDPDDRIVTIYDTLEENNYVLSEDEARDLLEAVSQEFFTEWSCVYNLDEFTVNVYIDTDYGHAYTFGGE